MSLRARYEPLHPHEEPHPVTLCQGCGLDLYLGDQGYRIEDEVYCDSCGYDKAHSELDEMKVDVAVGDLCEVCGWVFDTEGYETYKVDDLVRCSECATEAVVYSRRIDIEEDRW